MGTFVNISTERLKELEELEASIPSMIEKAVQEYKKSNLKKLHERDKANPAAINMRVKRYIERHREEINRKRREKRQQQKAAAAALTATETNTISIDQTPLKVESIFVRAATDAISKSTNPIIRKQYRKKKDVTDSKSEPPAVISTPDIRNDITVRFDT